MKLQAIKENFVNITNDKEFEDLAINVFYYQAENNLVYKRYLEYLKIKKETVSSLETIPFLPIQFFKSHQVITGNKSVSKVFKSSGTTASGRSQHLVSDLAIYEKSFIHGFNHFYGDIKNYVVLALLPSYLEQGESSLVYMVDKFIELSNHKESGYCLENLEETATLINQLKETGKKVLLIGVSYALLDLIEEQDFSLDSNFIIMETGGMKGRRKELTKKELHETLKKGFGVRQIHSEYGMTELLSQSYSLGNTKFKTPPWMKVLLREVNDPLSLQKKQKSGGINIIDLANINSCSFIATQDLGRKDISGDFEILGRFDHSDTRGCNLMIVD